VVKLIRKSALETWLECPKRYELLWIKKIPAKPTVSMQIGTYFHDFASKFFDKLDYDVLRKKTTWQDVIVYFGKFMPRHPILRPLVRNFFEFEARRWLKIVMLFDDPVRYFKPVDTERYFQADIDGIFLEGTVDRIDRLSDESLVNIEYKVANRLVLPDIRLELAFYNILINESKTYDQPVTHIGYYNPKINSWFSEKVSQKLLQTARRRILQFKRANELGIFEKRPGMRCFFCPVADECLKEA